jgi:hypothetical protein
MNACNAEHQQLVQALLEREHDLSPWERRMVTTLQARLAGGWPLTHHQVDQLNEAWDRITTSN